MTPLQRSGIAHLVGVGRFHFVRCALFRFLNIFSLKNAANNFVKRQLFTVQLHLDDLSEEFFSPFVFCLFVLCMFVTAGLRFYRVSLSTLFR